jgi:hypothetical protein
MLAPTRSHDVLLHVGADVCRCISFGSSLNLIDHEARKSKAQNNPHILTRRCAVDSDMASRECFNPHFHTFSIA